MNTSRYARILCFGIGASMATFGVFVSEGTLAAHFSPDGQITDVTFVYVLRGLCALTGITLAAVGAAAPGRIVQNLVLTSGAAVVSVGTLELGLRAADAFESSRTTAPTGLRRNAFPNIVYENTPAYYEDGVMKFNTLGMRDEERVITPERVRAVILGDSIEAWRDIPVLDMYPRLLESDLNRGSDDGSLQVANLAVTGYSLRQKLQMLKYRGLDLTPDVVVLSYCLNDPIPASELTNYFTGTPDREVWRSVEFINNRMRGLLHRYGVDFYSQIHRDDSPSWREVVDTFREFGRLATQHDLEIIVVIFPLMGDTALAYPWRDIHTRVSAVAAAEGLHVIDLLAPFSEAGFEAVRADNVHPNAKGHRIAADALTSRIRSLDLLAAREQL